MNALTEKLAATLADPLAAARSSPDPVAYVGFDLPLDLMQSTTRFFCHLPWTGGRPTPQADLWLESAFPGWARSMLQDWYLGAFDHFDAVVFTRGEDASQRLYYYVCELQRRGLLGGPRPLIFDVATIPGATSRRHCAVALRRIMAELELDEGALTKGIESANACRRVYAGLERERRAAGHLYENIARASLFAELMPVLVSADLPAAGPLQPLLFSGSSPPDDRFHLAAQAQGWNVVADLYQRTLSRHGDPVVAYDGTAVEVLAQRVNANPGGPRAFTDRSKMLLSEIERTGAQAAVLWFTEEDEALAWQVAQQRKALEAQGIPALVLTRQRWDGTAAPELMKVFLKEVRT